MIAADHHTKRARRRYAEGLEAAVRRSRAGAGMFSAAVPVSPEAGGDARRALLDLAERLRAPGPVSDEGLRQVRALLTDGAGPLFYGRPGELYEAARDARAALELTARN